MRRRGGVVCGLRFRVCACDHFETPFTIRSRLPFFSRPVAPGRRESALSRLEV